MSAHLRPGVLYSYVYYHPFFLALGSLFWGRDYTEKVMPEFPKEAKTDYMIEKMGMQPIPRQVESALCTWTRGPLVINMILKPH